LAIDRFGLDYDLPEKPSFLAIVASVGALGLPFPRSVEYQSVLRVQFTIVELPTAPVADEFRQGLPP